ncbi:hypothetical protein Q5741_18885 [Paenibacillus sp. JX-17]|uniref:Uncharacterized protein n=1 Tax=Paenibacillus lacisoli TaxID=3064525 RepID=A0ABT9CHY1_9BACL|nr:hypothetical protein [Paenibacillus sp. JX-17]MDO7908470.1 hypothetical protein [Paenibacillus sp. JX-17]
MPNQKKPLPEGNVIETYQFGETTVQICDDFVAKTPEQIRKVIFEMHAKGWAIINDMKPKSEAD